jgi:hypothetical protein
LKYFFVRQNDVHDSIINFSPVGSLWLAQLNCTWSISDLESGYFMRLPPLKKSTANEERQASTGHAQ